MQNISQKLEKTCVGIAGCGGLGSNVAMHLVRAGIGKLIICDFDKIEESNLNRQFYFKDQLGLNKAETLKQNLLRISEDTEIIAETARVDETNVLDIFEGTDILAECFDRAESKKMLIETVLTKTKLPVVSGNGMAGYGKSNEIKTRKVLKKLVIAGDGQSGIDKIKLLTSARVGIVAGHQANAIIEMIMENGA